MEQVRHSPSYILISPPASMRFLSFQVSVRTFHPRQDPRLRVAGSRL